MTIRVDSHTRCPRAEAALSHLAVLGRREALRLCRASGITTSVHGIWCCWWYWGAVYLLHSQPHCIPTVTNLELEHSLLSLGLIGSCLGHE